MTRNLKSVLRRQKSPTGCCCCCCCCGCCVSLPPPRCPPPPPPPPSSSSSSSYSSSSYYYYYYYYYHDLFPPSVLPVKTANKQHFSLEVFIVWLTLNRQVPAVLLVLKGFTQYVNHGLPNASHLPAVNQWTQRGIECKQNSKVEVYFIPQRGSHGTNYIFGNIKTNYW